MNLRDFCNAHFGRAGERLRSLLLRGKRMNLRDFCYANFGWAGRRLSKIYPGIERDLDAAYMKVHPDVYLSVVAFSSLLALAMPSVLFLLFLTGNWPRLPSPFGDLMVMPYPATFPAIITAIGILVAIPLIVIGIGFIIPKMGASHRISGLKIEIPYASMYISVMASGGLSPYESLIRLRRMDLLPKMQKEVSRIKSIVTSTGVDPVTAMEQAAKVVNLKDLKELLLGYASTVRTGGDTLHYLFNQTHAMFRNLSARIKALGDNMGMLMEAFTIVSILGVLGLNTVFIVGMSLPFAMNIPPNTFFFFSFVILPILSVVFIYLGDAAQISQPVSTWRTYLVFAAFVPVGILLGTQTALSFFDERFLLFPPVYNFVIWLRTLLNLAEGTEAAIGLGIALMVVAIPSFVADHYFVGREGSIQQGITQFLRDLVETRKSGLGPERCITALSTRDYKAFSKHIRMISQRLSWGYPIRQIYQEFRAKVRNWLALVNIYLLVDTLDVGGGTEESLETLAEFSESAKQLENEKRSALMPLTLVPYIGAVLLTATTVMFLQFFTNMSTMPMGVSVLSVALYRVLLPPLVLHSFMLGLVTGKVVSGRVSAGFKHSIFLILFALVGIWAVTNLSMNPYGGA